MRPRRVSSRLAPLAAIACGLVCAAAAAAQNIPRPNIVGPGGLRVNSYTGNLSYERTDLMIPGRGPALDLMFTYNSGETNLDHGYGPGWTNSYDMMWERAGASVFIRRSDGRQDEFVFQAGQYVHPVGVFDALEEYQPDRFRLTTKEGLQYWFETSSHRRLTRIRDPNGNQTTIAYSGGLPISITDPSGRVLALTWNSGHLATARDMSASPPREIAYFYDGCNNPIRVIDPLGNAHRYAYDSLSALVSVTDRRSNVFDAEYASGAARRMRSALTDQSITYDTGTARTIVTEQFAAGTRTTTYTFAPFAGSGRVTRITGNCCGFDVQYQYDADNNVTRITDALGGQTTRTYDARGNRLSETDPLTYTATFTYEPTFNHVTAATDKRGNTTTYSYDALGNLTSVSKPCGITESATYDALGQRATSTDGSGRTTTYGYDANGNTTSIAHPDATTESATYDNGSNRISATDERNNTTTYDYDALDRLIQTHDPLGNVESHAYDAEGNRVSTTDKRGNTTTYAYDALGRLTQTTTPAGTTSYVYDEGGNVTRTTDPNGNLTVDVYDARNLLVQTTDPLLFTASYGYDANGNRVTSTDKRGGTSSSTYDAMNRRLTDQDQLGNTTSHAYDANGNVISMTDPRSNTTTYQYDACDRLILQTNPLGGTISRAYDGNGNVTSVVDPNSNASTFRYDTRDRLVSERNALNDSTTYTYDAAGNRLSMRDPLGHITSYAYDALDRLTSSTNPLGETTSQSYDANGNSITSTRPTGNVVTTTYDAANRITAVSDLLGSVAAYSYDANSNRLSETNGSSNTTSYAYDGLDRLITRTLPGGQSENMGYDPNGNLTSKQDGNNNTTTYEYDAANRLTKTTDPLGHQASRTYDAAGNVTSKTDGNGVPTTFTYDALGRKTQETYADATTRQFGYDAVGNLLSRKDNNGSITTYTYDSINRLINRLHPMTGSDVYAWDADGRILTASNASANVTLAYDDADRVLSESLNGRVTSYSYNVPLRRRTILYPGGRVIQENMNVRDRLSTVREGASTIAGFSYDGANRMIARNYLNGSTMNEGYDPNSRPLNITHQRAGVFAGFVYAYDNAGNRLYQQKTHRPSNSEKYVYDPENRLIQYKEGNLVGGDVPAPVTQTSYNYDGAGNRTVVVKDGSPTNYAHNVVNEYTQVGAINPFYDANGNVLFDGAHQFAYDEENRRLTVDGGSTAQYKYDAFGRRIQKIAGATTTNYYYAGAQVIEERNASNVVTATYVWGQRPEPVLAMTIGGTQFYCHHNALGSLVAVTSAGGSVVERYEYDAYGHVSIFDAAFSPRSSSAIGNHILYEGTEYDAEAISNFFRGANYSPVLGRYDERNLVATTTFSSWYTYAENNPCGWATTQDQAKKKECCCAEDIDVVTNGDFKGGKSIEDYYPELKGNSALGDHPAAGRPSKAGPFKNDDHVGAQVQVTTKTSTVCGEGGICNFTQWVDVQKLVYGGRESKLQGTSFDDVKNSKRDQGKPPWRQDAGGEPSLADPTSIPNKPNSERKFVFSTCIVSGCTEKDKCKNKKCCQEWTAETTIDAEGKVTKNTVTPGAKKCE